ncbi:MAG: 6-phosphofructokinase [Sulfurimonas sp.]|nr:MAG: 6-phosphofructokinase [Sulfurimonas sp.]
MHAIAILCSGGDVSGMNPAIKRFVEYAFAKTLTPFLVYDGYEGLIDDRIQEAHYRDVSNIITQGGTFIGSSRSERFMLPKHRKQAALNLKKRHIAMLVILGGDGSFRGMHIFYREHGIACCGIPSTIDNDIAGTFYCLGVDTALGMIRTAIDAIRDTAASLNRAFVIETMGRECGYLALVSALTSGAELCLIPEIPYDFKALTGSIKQQLHKGRHYMIIVVSEGIAQEHETIISWLQNDVGIETRLNVLGHLQRGGTPSVYDRLMAYRFITYGIDGLLQGEKSSVVCYGAERFHYRQVDEVATTPYEIEAELLALGQHVCTLGAS